MRLVSFSVENYRSITKARKVALGDYTLLVGPNNEGKSNVLHALAVAMETLAGYRRVMTNRDGVFVEAYVRSPSTYSWDRDFPVQHQIKRPNGTSDVTLEFELTDDEVAQFYTSVKSRLNGTLPLKLSISKQTFTVSVQKRGPGQVNLTRKANAIARFVSEAMSFDYIPAVRTASSAAEVVNRLLESELGQLERDPEYLTALRKIDELQQPLLESLGASIQQTMKTFLPSVNAVKLNLPAGGRARALRRDVQVMIDDGVETSLSRKGDGVQSLVALSLMRHSAARREKASSVIAIEEPESHLHSRAIHELRSVITALSASAQVVVTSHSPLFVNRDRVASNIIVNDNRAKPASSLREVRDVLGVRFADNLQNASLVLLVEGSDDQKALMAILSERDATVREAIAAGLLQLDYLGGAGSLSYKASQYINSACRVHAFLDNDVAGKNAYDKARASKLLDVADVNFAVAAGMDESELEDLYDTKVYSAAFLAEFAVDVDIKLKGKKQKWSDATGRKFTASGKPWDDKVKEQVKNWLAAFAASQPKTIVHPQKVAVIEGLITSLKVQLKN